MLTAMLAPQQTCLRWPAVSCQHWDNAVGPLLRLRANPQWMDAGGPWWPSVHMLAGMKDEALETFVFEVEFTDDQLLTKGLKSCWTSYVRFKGIPTGATISRQPDGILGNVENHQSEHASTKKFNTGLYSKKINKYLRHHLKACESHSGWISPSCVGYISVNILVFVYWSHPVLHPL